MVPTRVILRVRKETEWRIPAGSIFLGAIYNSLQTRAALKTAKQLWKPVTAVTFAGVGETFWTYAVTLLGGGGGGGDQRNNDTKHFQNMCLMLDCLDMASNSKNPTHGI